MQVSLILLIPDQRFYISGKDPACAQEEPACLRKAG
jgi:hypothetical protein